MTVYLEWFIFDGSYSFFLSIKVWSDNFIDSNSPLKVLNYKTILKGRIFWFFNKILNGCCKISYIKVVVLRNKLWTINCAWKIITINCAYIINCTLRVCTIIQTNLTKRKKINFLHSISNKNKAWKFQKFQKNSQKKIFHQISQCNVQKTCK